ncbi:MAG: rhamnogalacturonan endolyase family protein, partial [Planctomycetota bacterium]
MMFRSLLNWIIGFLLLAGFSAGVSGAEKLDRGLIALEREDGSVFLSWRLLDTDSDGTAFIVKRRSPESSAGTVILTKGKQHRATNFSDDTAGRGKTYIYELYESGTKQWPGEIEIKLTGRPRPYISIPLNGDYDFQKVGIADMDGDGTY